MSGGDIARTAEIEWVRLAEQASIDTADADHVNLGLLDDGTLVFVDELGVSHVLAESGDVHDAVTLDSDAAVLLDLSGQEIGLDTQTANYLFAGPTTGAANEPTFRALVPADLDNDTTSGYLLGIDGTAIAWEPQYATVNVVIDDGGSEITTGEKLAFQWGYDGQLLGWEIVEATNTSGSIKIDLWVDTYAQFPPTDADSICGGNEPEVSGAVKAAGSVSGWTTAVTRGTWTIVNVDSVEDMVLATLALKLVRS